MANIVTRCEGAFIGHAIASQYDPSILMALNICDSLLENGQFNGPDILSRHLLLYHTKKCEIGETTKYIYQASLNNIKHKDDRSPLTRAHFLFDQSVINDTVKAADKKSDGLTAGCGPAQRSFPLAFCDYISDDELFTTTMQEAALTHYSPVAGQVAGIVNVICRSLLKNVSWREAVQYAFSAPKIDKDIENIVLCYGRRSSPLKETHAAYAPTVLHAALHYIDRSNNSAQAIATAHDNDKHYCAPIVGILAGARWGIPVEMFRDNISDAQLKPIRDTATKLSTLWKMKHDDVQA